MEQKYNSQPVVFDYKFLGEKKGYKSSNSVWHDIKDIKTGSLFEYESNYKKVVLVAEGLKSEKEILEQVKDMTFEEKINWYQSHIKNNLKINKSGLYELWSDTPKSLNIKKLKQKHSYAKYAYSLMISPGDVMLESNFFSSDKWHTTLQKNIETLLKDNKFSKNDFDVYYSFHGNTTHPHINVAMICKSSSHEKMKKRKNTNLDMRTIRDFKINLRKTINPNEDFFVDLKEYLSKIAESRKVVRSLLKNALGEQIKKSQHEFSFSFDNSTKMSSQKITSPKDFLELGLKVLSDVEKIQQYRIQHGKNKTSTPYYLLNKWSKDKISEIIDFTKLNQPQIGKALDEYFNDFKKLTDLESQTKNKDYLNAVKQTIKKEKQEFERALGNDVIKALQKSYKQTKQKLKSTIKNEKFQNNFMSYFFVNFSVLSDFSDEMKKSKIRFRSRSLKEYEARKKALGLAY